ncbi:MAG TPA: protein tyrosine phosphatase family protein [Thermoanaerobaculia bacterium]|nr:protein tyrosine phosphatase family protein [Thermoanaerobaculia bacterium]
MRLPATLSLLLLVIALLLPLAPPVAGQDPEPTLADAHRPEDGVLFGGQPDESQLRALAAAGYRVIDLRMPEENRGYDEAEAAQTLGLEYHNLPVGGATLSDPETFERFFELFETVERPVAVHCASGNRVGGLYYAWLVARQGVPREEALERARENGLTSEGLRETVDAYLDAHPPHDENP